MKKYLNILLVLLMGLSIPSQAFAGPGHSHDEVAPVDKHEGVSYASSEVFSDKYELLLRYDPIHPGEVAHMTLFISDYETNKPVNEAKISIIAQEDSGITFSIHQNGNGTYSIEATFPEKRDYSLAVRLEGPLGPDLMLLEHIEVGVEPELAPNSSLAHFLEDNNWILILLALLVGLFVGFLFRRKGRSLNTRTNILVLIFIGWAIPFQQAGAHGDDDHTGGSAGNNFSNTVPIPKETQFLFDIYTQKVSKGSFQESSHLFGTIFPSSNGQAIISADQNGTIAQVHVNVGQKVKKGQSLATIKKTIDVGTNIGLQAEANSLAAEYEAAKKEVERLSTISDIAAKRDIDEAASRLQKAETNLALFNSNSGKSMTLTAPIDGVVSNFKLSIGTTVTTGQTLFTITDLSLLYVEAQVFDRDAEKIVADAIYTMDCVNDHDTHVSSQVKLLSKALEINTTNQSQKVLFQVDNPNGDFKIGEFVNIRVFSPSPSLHITMPNSAITEINGKPVVFVKESAEKYTVSYVQIGHNNGTHTTILKGLEEGERVVVNGSYQLKMIFLNQ